MFIHHKANDFGALQLLLLTNYKLKVGIADFISE